MTKEQLLEIINDNDEKEYVEFKTNFPADKFYKEIGEYISALSNSATLHKQKDAYMIWGVEDTTRKIVGTIFKYDIQVNGSEVFKHFLARKLSPSIAFKFEEFEAFLLIILKWRETFSFNNEIKSVFVFDRILGNKSL